MASEQLKYGWIGGGKSSTRVPMAASQVAQNQSSKFVFMNAGAATLCIASSTTIFGSIEDSARTPETGEYLNCIIDLTAKFRIPINAGTFVVGMIGDLCDISISGTIHGATLDTSTRDLITIVGGDLVDNNYVECTMNPSKWGTLIGADA